MKTKQILILLIIILLSIVNVSCMDFFKDYEYKPKVNINKE